MTALALPGRWPRRRPAGRRGVTTAWYEANERRRVVWSAVIATAAALVLGPVVLWIGAAAVVAPLIVAALAAIVWQPKLGLLGALTLVMLFEMTSPDLLMTPGRYLTYGLQSSLGVSGFIASPLELLLLLTLAIWLTKGLVQHRLGYRGGDLGWPTALFFGSLLIGLVRGAAGGGDMYVAFWEVRSLLYLGVCYVLAANLIRTRRDVGILVSVLLVANGLYALEGAFRYVFLIRTGVLGVVSEFNYAHEVVIFLAVVMLQALVQLVLGGSLWRRVVGLMVAPIALFTLVATERRAGSIALAIAFVLIALPWLARHRKAILLILLPGLLAAAIYLPLFWNNTGFLSQPARAVRSLSAPDARDASSNEYREQEAINVRETIRSDPLLGVGFGRQFLFVVPLPDLSWWPFWKYQPHNNVLWVWLKVGAPGFTVFLILMFGSLALASSRALTLHDRTLVTFAYVSIASVVASLVFCYVDLGLTNGRLTVFLGSVLGVLAVLRRIEQEDPPAPPAARQAGAGRPWPR
jgi:O-antigen ligase